MTVRTVPSCTMAIQVRMQTTVSHWELQNLLAGGSVLQVASSFGLSHSGTDILRFCSAQSVTFHSLR